MPKELPSTGKRAIVEGEALRALKAARTPLFAVLDAAQGNEVRRFLGKVARERQSLYEGPEAREMEEVAPYLLMLSGRPRRLERLVEKGWGKNWGILLTSARPFLEVRRQLRKQLLVEEEGTSKRLYFRFYDPRVLRIFLPSCTRDQLQQFYGCIDAFYAEGEDGSLLHFPRPAE